MDEHCPNPVSHDPERLVQRFFISEFILRVSDP
jgi:hypothetical protein